MGPDTGYWSANYAWVGARYDRFIYLDRVVVAPRARGRGLARALYDEVTARSAASADHFVLEVNTEPRNDESLAFHAALGFAEVGRARPYGDDTEVAYLSRPVPGP